MGRGREHQEGQRGLQAELPSARAVVRASHRRLSTAITTACRRCVPFTPTMCRSRGWWTSATTSSSTGTAPSSRDAGPATTDPGKCTTPRIVATSRFGRGRRRLQLGKRGDQPHGQLPECRPAPQMTPLKKLLAWEADRHRPKPRGTHVFNGRRMKVIAGHCARAPRHAPATSSTRGCRRFATR